MGESLLARTINALVVRLGDGGGQRSKVVGWLVANRREVSRFIRFGLVGTLGTVVDFAVLNLLILSLAWPKSWANALSFSIAALSNFVWNRVWTFPESRRRPLGQQLAQFFAVSVAGFVINQALFLSLDQWLFQGWGVWGYNLAKAIAIVAVLFWNFWVNRLWTYRGL